MAAAGAGGMEIGFEDGGDGDWDMDGDDEFFSGRKGKKDTGPPADPREFIIDIREYDVTYYLRTAIDLEIRCGLWYAVSFPHLTGGTTTSPSKSAALASHPQPSLTPLPQRIKRADPIVMAYDIETTKSPLKFPDSAFDRVIMISYMIDGQGYLIVNREIVSADIDDFEYTPREGYEGPFTIFNVANEEETIKKWFAHIRDVRPTVMATFNGDFFDFPFLEARSKVYGLDMGLEIGFVRDSEDEFKSRTCVHMDCFRCRSVVSFDSVDGCTDALHVDG
jgi:DNA polymerase epsilon subunit 1